MKPSERLVHSSPNELTRRLLEAGLRDDPSASSLRGIATGLGLAVSASVVSALAVRASVGRGPAEAGAVTARAAPGGISAASASLTAGVVQWLAIGAIAGSAVSAGSLAIQRASQKDAPALPASAAPPRAARSVTLAAAHEPATASEGSATEPLPAKRALPRAAGTSRSGAHAGKGVVEAASAPERPIERDGALARETAWIDAARRALEDGQLMEASAALDEYDAGRRIGVLNREALVLRVEVSFRQRNFVEARALVDRFEASYPGDPYVASLRSRLAQLARGIDLATPRH